MNPLLTPELGTYVWSLVIFMTVLFVLRKYAWNPLLDFLEEREKDIAESLKMAESAKTCLLYTSPSPRDATTSRMPSSA